MGEETKTKNFLNKDGGREDDQGKGDGLTEDDGLIDDGLLEEPEPEKEGESNPFDEKEYIE